MSVNSAQSIADNRVKYARYFTTQDKDAFSMENFFTLLMAEMKHQDPLEPMSNTEFISQLANFTALKAQQDALYYQNANYAQSIVGKTVTVASMGGGKFAVESGIVTSMSVTDGNFQIKVNGKNYSLSSIMEILPTQNPYTITGNDGAYATSLIGKHVTVVGRSEDGRQMVESGTVTRFEVKDNEINIIIDDRAYPLSSVIKVEDAEGANNNTTTVTPNDWAYATSLIGKLVTVTEPPDNEGFGGWSDTGIVEKVEIIGSSIMLIIEGHPYKLVLVTGVEEVEKTQVQTPPTAPATVADIAAATPLIGKHVTLLEPGKGIEYATSGVVTHIVMLNNQVSVVVNNDAHPLKHILAVHAEAPPADTDTDTDNTDNPDND
jgi:flagellar basal-body rod modification protein FlgD